MWILTWRMRQGEVESGLHTREVWESHWQDSGVGRQARVALNWSLLPTQQHFEPGDYNWGLTAYGVPPGSGFDLRVSWREGDVERLGEILGIECAPDVDRLK